MVKAQQLLLPCLDSLDSSIQLKIRKLLVLVARLYPATKPPPNQARRRRVSRARDKGITLFFYIPFRNGHTCFWNVMGHTCFLSKERSIFPKRDTPCPNHFCVKIQPWTLLERETPSFVAFFQQQSTSKNRGKSTVSNKKKQAMLGFYQQLKHTCEKVLKAAHQRLSSTATVTAAVGAVTAASSTAALASKNPGGGGGKAPMMMMTAVSQETAGASLAQGPLVQGTVLIPVLRTLAAVWTPASKTS